MPERRKTKVTAKKAAAKKAVATKAAAKKAVATKAVAKKAVATKAVATKAVATKPVKAVAAKAKVAVKRTVVEVDPTTRAPVKMVVSKVKATSRSERERPTVQPGKIPKALRPVYDAVCRWVGKAAIDEQLAHINSDTTPYLFMVRMATHVPALAPKLAPAAGENVLAYLLQPENEHLIEHIEEVRGIDPSELGRIKPINPDHYAEAGQRIIDRGRLITLRGAAVICASGINGGDIWEIDADRAINHGSVDALVADLHDRLG